MTQYCGPMDNAVLLKSQKNEILKLIKQRGLDPSSFEWSILPDESEPELEALSLTHIESEFYYVFVFIRGEHRAVFSPGKESLVEDGSPGSWFLQRDYFKDWLSYLRREIGQRDLWAEIAKYQLPPGGGVAPDITNEPFSASEIEQITSALQQIRQFITAQGKATEEQQTMVQERLDYLANAAKRQGRKDWIYTCFGVLVSVAVQLALAPEQASKMWEIIRNALSGIMQFLPR